MKTFLNMPFDEDVFLHSWYHEPDLVTTLLLESGAVVEDPTITAALAGGGQTFTVPFYKDLGGDPVLYNGKTDIPTDEIEGGYQTGVAYGFAKGWKERDFVRDLVGNDPMGAIVSKIARYWRVYHQGVLVKLLDTAVSVTGMTSHAITVNYKDDALEKLAADLNSEVAKVFKGGRAGIRVLIMNTATAVLFENINLLKYRTGVDASALVQDPRIGEFLGMNVIVDDYSGLKDGEIYALGYGAIRTGIAPVEHPVGWERSESKNGGETAIFTRQRKVLHPDGLSYTMPSSVDGSPTLTELTAKANWKLAHKAECVPIAKVTLKAAGAGGP